MSAVDLLMLFQSFIPPASVILSVSIILSDFGKQKIEEEKRYGPKDLIVDGEFSENKQNTDKLREYEKNKLKYYYAVVECDSAKTALAIYQQCDKFEFERTGNVLDLRFIPDDVQIVNERTDTATEVPMNYKPPEGFSKVFQHTNLALTWDKNDEKRTKLLSEKTLKEEVDDDDFRAYLGSSDSEEDSAGEEENREEKKKRKSETTRKKYAELLQGLNQDDKEDDTNMDMEITFLPGLGDSMKKAVEKRIEDKDKEEETVWEAYQRKRKEERRSRRQEKKQKEKEEDEEQKLKIEAAKGKKVKLTAEEQEDLDRRRAELELLVMDEDMEDSTTKRGKRKQAAKTDLGFDATDSRFGALLTDNEYYLDPTVANKDQKRVAQLVRDEKEKRKRTGETNKLVGAQNGNKGNKNVARNAPKERDVMSLAESVKRKAAKRKPKQAPRNTVPSKRLKINHF
eukprot:TRINITY_DN1104_c0_g1_i1.p1 TRINITY_DN1104_c0_g1~~TRINITY_DN1104_c0_g1_i1.p1  ORF type:complete len:455 (+),score=138.76 TRINITY_DN1104_c0_g1_i1:485-1849(+)